MPHRDRATVARWVKEYHDERSGLEFPFSVLEQDAETTDTALVVVELRTATTVTYIQPVTTDKPRWMVTFEARDHDLDLDASQVSKLSHDLGILASLCGFLQKKTDEALERAAAGIISPPYPEEAGDPLFADEPRLDLAGAAGAAGEVARADSTGEHQL